MKTGRLLLSALLLLLAATLCVAQTVTGTLEAVLVDPSGAFVPSAPCTLTNQATGAILNSPSDSAGLVRFLNILPGTYTLKVEPSGFRRLELKDITVSANQVRSMGNLTLAVGAVQDSVTITADPTPIQLATAEKSGTLTGDQLNSLALKGRDFMGMLLTIPGVVDTNSAGRDAADPTSLGGTYINGTRDSSKNFTVDGIVDMDSGSNETVAFAPPMDTIAEVKVLTSNYQAEYGRNAGAVITVVTKSGTQLFHGGAYDYYRHESLNANTWLNNQTKTQKAPYRYRITGFNLGGPVYIPGKFNQNKSKVFFFWSEEFTGIKKNYATAFANTPTDLEKSGDFSDSRDAAGNLIVIKDPTTGAAFPLNKIPAGQINSLGQAVLKFFPQPNYVDPNPAFRFQRNHRDTFSGQYDRRNDLIRGDFNLTPTLSFYYRWANDHDEQTVPWGNWIIGSENWLISPAQFGQPGHQHAAHLIKVFSPTLINDFSFGKTYNKVVADFTNPSAVSRSAMGNFPTWFGNATYIPNVSFGSVNPSNPVNASLYSQLPYLNHTDIWVVNDTLSKSWGAHNVKAGIYIERNGKLSPTYLAYRGSVAFTRSTLNPLDTNDAFSNALVGNYYSYLEGNKRLSGDWWFSNVEWFLQDNWRVTKKLTLDFGIRFAHLPGIDDHNNTMSTFVPSLYSASKSPRIYRPAINPANGQRMAQDPQTGAFAPVTLIGFFVPNTGDPANGMAVAGQGVPNTLAEFSALDISPRFGLAYDVFGSGKLALHAGFGTFKERTSIIPAVYAAGYPPVGYTPYSYFGTLSTLTQASGYLSPSSPTIFTGRANTPMTMNYSFGLQGLVKNNAIDVSYVGGLSRHLWVNRPINNIPIGARFQSGNIDSTTGSPLPDNFLRPYYGWGSILSQEFAGTSNYNALQMKLERRYKAGLQYGVSYTFAKALGSESTEWDSISGYFSPRQWNYGPLASSSRAHSFVANYSWELPKLGKKLGSRPLGWVTDNWTWSGITSFITGTPYMPGMSTTDGQDITGSSEGARATVVGNVCSGPNGFNPSALARTPKGSFGNLGVGVCTGPGINNWDMAFAKRFPLKSEARTLQFRAEMFNAFNHTQYSAIDGGVIFNPAGQNTNPTSGMYTNARTPRIMEFSLRFSF
ncbi:MAG TPA: carboxypeptidase regulatory-like domain-containing protein [Bryobacteraceae bacterium]|jgi:hypothetical protein